MLGPTELMAQPLKFYVANGELNVSSIPALQLETSVAAVTLTSSGTTGSSMTSTESQVLCLFYKAFAQRDSFLVSGCLGSCSVGPADQVV